VTIPSRVLASGVSQLSTVSICGDGLDDIIAAGTSAGNATQLTHVYNAVNTTPSSSGVMLPPCEMGAVVIVVNSGANTLTVYPKSSDTINATTSSSIAQDDTSLFFAVSNTQWFSLVGDRT